MDLAMKLRKGLTRPALFWVLLLITLAGDLLVGRAMLVLITGRDLAHLAYLLELVVAGLLVMNWVVKLPSGASWRPGSALVSMGVYLIDSPLVVLPNMVALMLITARARAPWYKYFETAAHGALPLYLSALTYRHLLDAWTTTPYSKLLAVFTALLVHLTANRLISSIIVAHRDRRSLAAQIQLIVRELHWGYFNSYILTLLVAMLDPHYMPFGIAIAVLIQASVFLAVSNYSTIKTLQTSLRTDGLSALENRLSWEEMLAEPAQTPGGTRLYVIDVNNFKDLNDRYGHLAGDQVLREVSGLLKSGSPAGSRIFRVGGDEFVIYIDPKLKPLDPQKIHGPLTALHPKLGMHEPITLSIGEAVAPGDGTSVTELFQAADLRMYAYKRNLRYSETGVEFGIPASIQSLVFAIESRDAYTSGHSLRVAFYAWKLAQHMELSPSVQQTVFRAGLVHDVGKIGIPDHILNKQGKLTTEEFDVVKRHPETGYEMCRKLGFSQSELDIIRYHHERWDGAGYPLGLAGENIPLLARIAAVADVYDALTSTRSYRSAWTHEQAMAHLVSMRGVHFDPVCADAWVELNAHKPLSEEYLVWMKDARFLL